MDRYRIGQRWMTHWDVWLLLLVAFEAAYSAYERGHYLTIALGAICVIGGLRRDWHEWDLRRSADPAKPEVR